MKKAKKSTAKASRKSVRRARKAAPAKKRLARRPIRPGRSRSVSAGKVAAPTKGTALPGARSHDRAAANLAAGVLSRRAAKVQTLAQAAASERPHVKPQTKTPTPGRHGKSIAAKPGKAHGAASLPGNRPLVRVARVPTFNYMRAPGANSGYDVGDSVEVFCDHEKDGERVRGWVKGVVVQVDNKLVAVQFRSNVFLTDGWMVPDRILWYSLGSDQIRNVGVGRKAIRPAVPEY